MAKLIDNTDIKELRRRYSELCVNLTDDLTLKEFVNMANEMAILSVRIKTYEKNSETPIRQERPTEKIKW